MAASHTIRSVLSGTPLGRIANDPRIAAPLVAVGINVSLGIASCLGYHTATGQQFAPDPQCLAVYLYTSLGALAVGYVGVTRYDRLPGRSPRGKVLTLVAVTWPLFVAMTFLPGASSLARRGVAPTMAYYAIAALAVMGALVYVRRRVVE